MSCVTVSLSGYYANKNLVNEQGLVGINMCFRDYSFVKAVSKVGE